MLLPISSLCEQVRTLEGEAEERQAAVTRLQEAERQRHSDQRRMNVVGKRSGLRRYHSFENGFLDRITDAPGDPYLDEIHRQRDSIRYLKQQQAVERRRREDAERELCSLLQENSALETRLRDAGATWQEKLAAMQAQMQRAAIDSRKLCARCRSSLEVAPPRLESEVEHEDVREIRDAECLKLRSGGSLYASQEALRSYVDRREI
ncbi:PREDICTED: cerebellar degeneration-related protein 2-like, partial [Priapulus caudatus]|uniref:Cerebellar degeneration-related protein 2-like n=1 Tax=Priapulus caudatus TaxID=37621 RepID=A0ABM1EF85_PRICU